MLEHLITERRNPRSASIDTLPTLDMVTLMNEEDRTAFDAVQAVLPQIASAIDVISAAMQAGGRLFYIGAGTSGRLGVLDASECPPTFGVSPDLVRGIIAGGEAALSRATEASEDDPESGARDLLSSGFTSRDVVTGIAASGRTPYVLGAIRSARNLGASTVGISCTKPSELTAICDHPIELITGPEIITGSTRLKAGTATKLVLNMLSTGAMIRLGYVYGNLMVNVQPKNVKLRDRARRIVRDAAGVSEERAAQLLDEGGSVRVAIVMAKKALERSAAERLLERSGGSVGKALELEWKS